jgi:hypothetical protein
MDPRSSRERHAMPWARNVVMFSLVAEAGTALTVLLAPGLVASPLFGTSLAGAGAAFARMVGVALGALVLACWPATAAAASDGRAAARALAVYNLLAAVCLVYVRIADRLVGPLLWPAVVAHAVVGSFLALRSTTWPPPRSC